MFMVFSILLSTNTDASHTHSSLPNRSYRIFLKGLWNRFPYIIICAKSVFISVRPVFIKYLTKSNPKYYTQKTLLIRKTICIHVQLCWDLFKTVKHVKLPTLMSARAPTVTLFQQLFCRLAWLLGMSPFRHHSPKYKCIAPRACELWAFESKVKGAVRMFGNL